LDAFVDGLLNQGRAEMLLDLLETRFGAAVVAQLREANAG
jgi:hypothetical protein